MGDFDSVDTGEDINRIRAEDRDTGHVDVVKGAKVEELSEVWTEGDGDDDDGYAEVDEVDDQYWYCGEGGDEELVPPADIEEVIAYAENGDGLEGEDCGEVGCQLSNKLEGSSHLGYPV